MAFRVEILPRAKQDRRIIQQAPLKGPPWFNGLEQSILSLSHAPERCPVSRKLSTKTEIVRRMLYGTFPHIYHVYYWVMDDRVEIRHSARREPSWREVAK